MQAMFNHMGTTQEYLHHFCRNEVLFNSYKLGVETMVSDIEDGVEEPAESAEPKTKKHKSSHFENCIVMHSVLHDRNR